MATGRSLAEGEGPGPARAGLLRREELPHRRWLFHIFELNVHEQNRFYKSTFLSTLHLFNNVVGQSGGDGFHLYALDKPIGPTELNCFPI